MKGATWNGSWIDSRAVRGSKAWLDYTVRLCTRFYRTQSKPSAIDLVLGASQTLMNEEASHHLCQAAFLSYLRLIYFSFIPILLFFSSADE